MQSNLGVEWHVWITDAAERGRSEVNTCENRNVVNTNLKRKMKDMKKKKEKKMTRTACKKSYRCLEVINQINSSNFFIGFSSFFVGGIERHLTNSMQKAQQIHANVICRLLVASIKGVSAQEKFSAKICKVSTAYKAQFYFILIIYFIKKTNPQNHSGSFTLV